MPVLTDAELIAAITYPCVSCNGTGHDGVDETGVSLPCMVCGGGGYHHKEPVRAGRDVEAAVLRKVRRPWWPFGRG